MTDQPFATAAPVAHGLNIESGGSRAERFAYGWCPCGWQYSDPQTDGYSADRIKLAFAAHLRGLNRA